MSSPTAFSDRNHREVATLAIVRTRTTVVTRDVQIPAAL